MSQAKLTEFYNGRKRGSGYQPSKKRKVLVDSDVTTASIPVTSVVTTTAPKVRLSFEEALSGSVLPKRPTQEMPQPIASSSVALTKGKLTVDSKQVSATSSTAAVKGKSTVSQMKTQAKVKRSQKPATSGLRDIRSMVSGNGSNTARKNEVTSSAIAIPTAVCDDHGNSHPSTPTKRQQKDGSETSQHCKRGRQLVPSEITTGGDLCRTPQKFDFTPFAESEKSTIKSPSSSARKKLVLSRTSTNEHMNVSPPVFSFKGQESIEKVSTKVVSCSVII